jgi:hypothetical protein
LRPFDVVALNPYRSNPLPPLAEQPGSGIMPIMTMTLPDGEPEAGHWRIEPISAVVRLLTEAAGARASRTRVIAVDGRSSSGKTTLAGRLAGSIENSHVVHTDDVAWHHSIFGWVDLLTDGHSAPNPLQDACRFGRCVGSTRPTRGHRGTVRYLDPDRGGRRRGAPRACRRGRRERVGAVRLATMDQRNLIRVGNGELPMSVHEAWMAEELAFLAAHRPWERASLIVAGTPVLQHDPETELVVAPVMAR